MKNGQIKTVAAAIAVLFSLIAGVWAFDKHFTPRETFTIGMQSIQKQFTIIQKQSALDNAYRDVQFWTQQEASLRTQLATVQRGTALYDELNRQLNEAVKQKGAAQRYLNKLKSK